jgi:biopolymer transport protein ExbB/TolQ
MIAGAELVPLLALMALAVAAPVVAVVVYFERRMARVEAKIDASSKDFRELKESFLRML